MTRYQFTIPNDRGWNTMYIIASNEYEAKGMALERHNHEALAHGRGDILASLPAGTVCRVVHP